MSFRNVFLGAVPSLADINTVPNVATAATESTAAASNSSTARIRSMTRGTSTFDVPDDQASTPLSLANPSRCQVFYRAYLNDSAGDDRSLGYLSALSTTAITFDRKQHGEHSFVVFEVLEWV